MYIILYLSILEENEIYFIGAEILKDYQTFAQMIKFRQTEAKKSVIIKISEISHIEHLKKFCEYYAKIVNVFPYNTIDNNVSTNISLIFSFFL